MIIIVIFRSWVNHLMKAPISYMMRQILTVYCHGYVRFRMRGWSGFPFVEFHCICGCLWLQDNTCTAGASPVCPTYSMILLIFKGILWSGWTLTWCNQLSMITLSFDICMLVLLFDWWSLFSFSTLFQVGINIDWLRFSRSIPDLFMNHWRLSIIAKCPWLSFDFTFYTIMIFFLHL